MWPDLAKFRHFGESLQVFGKFLTVYFLFGKMLNLLGQIFDIIGPIFIFANGQILTNNITIWSHWLGLKVSTVPTIVTGLNITYLPTQSDVNTYAYYAAYKESTKHCGCVAQLVERSLLIQRSAVRIQSSAKINIEHLCTVNCAIRRRK